MSVTSCSSINTKANFPVRVIITTTISNVFSNCYFKVLTLFRIYFQVLGNDRLGCLLFVKSEEYTNLNEVEANEEDKAKQSDDVTWLYIATVLDRFFFVLYVIATVIIAVALATPR